MFRTPILHLQERSYAVCCNLVCLDTSCCYEGEGRTAHQIATYNIRTLLKMDYWSPKHVELLNVMNKINHQILCILLDYRHIAKWYTVHTVSNRFNYDYVHQRHWFISPSTTHNTAFTSATLPAFPKISFGPSKFILAILFILAPRCYMCFIITHSPI